MSDTVGTSWFNTDIEYAPIFRIEQIWREIDSESWLHNGSSQPGGFLPHRLITEILIVIFSHTCRITFTRARVFAKLRGSDTSDAFTALLISGLFPVSVSRYFRWTEHVTCAFHFFLDLSICLVCCWVANSFRLKKFSRKGRYELKVHELSRPL